MSGLDTTATRSILCSAGVILCTIHAQDFKDMFGDAQVGRTTIPIVYPKVARPTLMFAIIAWSIALTVMWELPPVLCFAFLIFGAFVGWRFLAKSSQKDDAESLTNYMVRPLQYHS